MEESSRRLSGALFWAFLFACLQPEPSPATAFPQDIQAGISAWWEVRLVVTAEGEYSVKGGQTPVAGTYTCKASWEGRLEPDGEDFLLVHIKTEILEWRLRETSRPAGRESVLEPPAAAKPAFRMSYVLKDGREVEFVFEISAFQVPLQVSPVSVPLELPRSSSRTAGLPGQGYGDFVCRGSSRIVIPETDLARLRPERSFSWDWRKERQVVKGGRVFSVSQAHTAKAVITLAAH
jgi:hypothetical protein